MTVVEAEKVHDPGIHPMQEKYKNIKNNCSKNVEYVYLST